MMDLVMGYQWWRIPGETIGGGRRDIASEGQCFGQDCDTGIEAILHRVGTTAVTIHKDNGDTITFVTLFKPEGF